MSAPLELRRAIATLLAKAEESDTDDSRRGTRKRSLKPVEREALVGPLLAELKALDPGQGLKLSRLREIVQMQRAKGRKVLVFAERLATAHYLHTELRKQLPDVEIGTTVRGDVDRMTFGLKTEPQRKRVIRTFAPRANPGYRLRGAAETNVLVCTDADGIGQDLDDADVVINYDLPLSIDELFQRAGRVLRMSDRADRVVDIYTLVPSVEDETTKGGQALALMIDRLEQRHSSSRALVGGCLLPPDAEGSAPAEIPLATAEDIENLPVWFHPPEDDLQVSPVPEVLHRSVFRLHEAEAASLPTVMMSARATHLSDPHVLILAQEGNSQPTIAILYNIATQSLVKPTRTELLHLLCCTPEAPKAQVSPKKVELASLEAVRAWRTALPHSDVPEPEMNRLGWVYLQPQGKDGECDRDVDGILQELASPKQARTAA